MDATAPLLRDDDLPRTLLEFAQRFATEEACQALLRRWKYAEAGFRCPGCGGAECWHLAGQRLDECRACGRQTSLTAGTVFHGSRTSLTKWFLGLYLFVSSKQGVSAVELGRQVGVSYPTAWTWLQKLRRALGARKAAPLEGLVEVDETYEGGVEHGKTGRGAVTKALIGGAVEIAPDDRGYGRARLQVIRDASAETLKTLLAETVKPGSSVLTDGWAGYTPSATEGLEHYAVAVASSGKQAHEVLPGVHRVFSLMHRVLLATHQGAVSRKHLQGYLDEFTFRFNRRSSASRGLLFQRLLSVAVASRPLAYWQVLGRVAPNVPLEKVKGRRSKVA
jgi:transposase-like protein